MYFSTNAVFMKVSLHSEMCKHLGKSLHGTANLFICREYFFHPAFLTQELHLTYDCFVLVFIFECGMSIRKKTHRNSLCYEKTTGIHYCI